MKSIDCLVVGSVNIDNIFAVNHICKPGETILSSMHEEASGGKGSNQAATLCKSGLSCALVACIGNDGIWIKTLLHQLGVITTFINVSPTISTGRAMIQVSEQDGDNAIVLFNGANDKVIFDHSKIDLSWKWLLLQGEINLEACRDAIEYSVKRSKISSSECVICLNAAPCSRKLMETIPLQLVDVLIVNETELLDVSSFLLLKNNRDTRDLINSTRELSKAISQKLPTLKAVVTTLGEFGACAFLSNSIFLHCPVKRVVKVIDTVGAGDTFCGYFIAAMNHSSLQSKKLISECLLDSIIMYNALSRAIIASGLACEKKGALPSIPDQKDIDSYSGQVDASI